jgi:hypothetical protein
LVVQLVEGTKLLVEVLVLIIKVVEEEQVLEILLLDLYKLEVLAVLV